MATKTITIKVQASPAAQVARLVVLFERDPNHPGDGEVFISGNGTIHEVYPTAAVKQRLHDGLLVEVGAKAKAGE